MSEIEDLTAGYWWNLAGKLEAELSALCARTRRANNFLNGAKLADELTECERILLSSQMSVMNLYAQLLRKRMEIARRRALDLEEAQ